MNQDLSILQLVLGASFVVQLVMLPNVGHVPQEEAAAASATAVREFLYAVGERVYEAMSSAQVE